MGWQSGSASAKRVGRAGKERSEQEEEDESYTAR